MTGLLADKLGQVLETSHTCPCGDTFTTKARVVPDSRNTALATCVDLTFHEFRAWSRTHRPHRRTE
ncbi:hypothetical protein C7H75_24590 (plasmid) [Prescottella equi]|nr:hypothetical protein C7H75_24590 [Prescottella equi]